MITTEQFMAILTEGIERKDTIIVRRNGKEHFRHYKRPIKNGMNLRDLIVSPAPEVRDFIERRYGQ